MDKLTTQQKLMIGGGVLVSLALGGVGYWFYQKKIEEEEEKELAKKMSEIEVSHPDNVVHVFHGSKIEVPLEKKEPK